MPAKKIWANFSVKDAKRTKDFYMNLGLKPTSFNSDPKLASFLFSDEPFIIHFFEQGTGIDNYINGVADNKNEIIFTLSADTEQEVREWESKVKAAGGKIFQKLKRDENGYYGFGFEDPDGHRFNILLLDNM